MFLNALLKISLVFLPLVVKKSLAQEVASPDLNFDPTSWRVVALEPPVFSGECESLYQDLQNYKTLELKNRRSFEIYFDGLQSLLSKWYLILKKFEGRKVVFSQNTFYPFKDLLQNLGSTVPIMEVNSVMSDDYLYEFTEFFIECSEDEKLEGLIEIYAANFFATQAELWRYLLDTLTALKALYEEYKTIEQQETVFKVGYFLALDKLSSYELGSGGVGEMAELMGRVYKEYYSVEFEKIEKAIKKIIEVNHVKR